MTSSNTCSRTSESTYSRPTGEPGLSKNVISLGEKIVAELDQDQSVDTLSRWMAHCIAEKIDDAATASGKDRDRKMSECSDLILKVWAHRNELPNGRRPFEDIEPVIRVIKSLDVDDTTPRYFREGDLTTDLKKVDETVAQWLRNALEIDRTARMLIRYCLAVASRDAVDECKDWLSLVEAMDEQRDHGVVTVRFISDVVDSIDAMNEEDIEKEIVEDLLNRMKKISDLCDSLSSQLREQLERPGE